MITAPPPDPHTVLRAFADELARCGMRAACTSPGSRSAPLVLALAREQRLRCFSHIDERCAGFFALGMAKASGLPVAVACTSGTAAAQLHAAAVEAHEARVPLLLLTADRPAELRENGAGQAIDQLKLFGSSAKWFFEVELPPATDAAALRWIRTLACRAYATTLEGAPGAVHLNFPLREPLISEGKLPRDDSGRADGRPFLSRPAPVAGAAQAQLLAELTGDAERGVIVAGRHERATPLGEAAAALAERRGWPLLADPMSRARRGTAAIAHYDALLRDASFAEAQRPDVIVRTGDLPVSKPLRTWLARQREAVQVALDPEGAWQDPEATLAHSLALEPAAALQALADAAAPAATTDWLQRWRSADERASEAIAAALAGSLSEPRVAVELGMLLPAEATLFVASSMPVRDIETFWPGRPDPPRVLCNRGANGIDGTVSSAFGAAAAADAPVVLLIGDVALAHDIGGLLAAGRLGLKLTIVLLDNEGGGIFDFLPVSGVERDFYTTHVATPTGLDFEQASALYGLAYERPEDIASFRTALERALAAERSALVHMRGSRDRNVLLHREVWAAVARSLAA